MRSFSGASRMRSAGGHSIGAEENTGVMLFSDLMDSTRFFLTPNADTLHWRRSST